MEDTRLYIVNEKNTSCILDISRGATLLVNNKGEISTNSSIKVTAKILSHELDKKIIVFKQKRRKGYQKKNGHKQAYTKIVIQDLKSAAKTTKKKTAAKKTTTSKTKKVETDK